MRNKKIQKPRIGLTGITGGLGRRMAELLSKNDFSIKALVRKGSDLNGLPSKIEFVFGDIRDAGSLPEFINEIDICIHLAAQVAHTSKKEMFAVNIGGTENLCKTILEFNPDCRFIHCSTISTLKINPVFRFLSSRYGISKYYAEKLVLRYGKNENLKATIIYPGLIYGRYDKSFVPQIINAIKKGRIKLIKGGECNAPLIYVDELCDLFIRAALSNTSIGKRYISVKGIDMGIHEVIQIIAHKLKMNVPGKIYPKLPLFIFSMLIEMYFSLFHKGKRPFINRTMVDVFSINFNDYRKTYDNPKKDLNWEQNRSKEYFEKNISEILTRVISAPDTVVTIICKC
jgi:nucleoside-diphosphate-sugar epimerase